MNFTSLHMLLDRCRDGKKMRVVAVCAQDEDVLAALDRAAREGIVDGVLVGSKPKIEKVAADLGINLAPFEIVDAPTEYEASEQAVRLVSSGAADTLMKGMVKTATLLKAVLNKEWGLRSGELLSHLFLMEIPKLKRVVGHTDGGINLYPDLKTKVGILTNAVDCYH